MNSDSISKMLFERLSRDAYEQDREDNAVNEQNYEAPNEQPYHNALPAFHERPEDEVLRGIKAMKTNNDFLIRALRRAGVLAALILALTVPEAVYAMSSCPMHTYSPCYPTGQTKFQGSPPTQWYEYHCGCGDSWWEQQ